MAERRSVPSVQDGIPPGEYRFHFLSGRPSLDFAATVGERWRRAFERLRTEEDLARWLEQSGILPSRPAVSRMLLEEARELREAIYRVAKLAGEGTPNARDLAVINRWSAAPALAPQLSRERRVSWSAADPARAALATLARDAIDLVSGPLAGRVRECAREDCALLFVDKSRPGTRRWCSMGGCGNRAKTSAYRRRRSAPARTERSPDA